MRPVTKRTAGGVQGRRQMPKAQVVLDYWGPTLERMGKADQEELRDAFTANPCRGICFACGFIRPLARAHIVARADGGSDHAGNLHLLCRRCHTKHDYRFKEFRIDK